MGVEDGDRASQILREFYVWGIDPESGLVTSEVYCGSANVAAVADLLNLPFSKVNSHNSIDIDERAIREISRFFSISLKFRSDGETALCSWSPLDGLPYRLHTRRELILMVSGRKPLCSLIGSIPPNESFEEIPEYLFDPYVAGGKFLKREYCEINSVQASPFRGLRVVLYALVKEAWRLEAYIQIRFAAKKLGWNESLTYQEGCLLGYSEPENDAWIEILRRRG